MSSPPSYHGQDDEIAGRIETFLEQTDSEFAPDDDGGEPDKGEGSNEPASQEEAEPEVSQETDEETEGEEGKPEQAGEEGQPDDDDSGAVETLSDLAQAFEVEEDAILDGLNVTPAEGAEPVSLRALVDRYNEGPQTATDPAVELAFKQKQTELEGEYSQRQQDLQILTTAMLDILDGEKSQLASLENDPHAYMELRTAIDKKQEAVQRAIGHFRKNEAELTERRNEEFEATIKIEADKLMKARPAWREEAPRREAMAQINAHLKARGFEDSEINELYDSRMVLIAHEASEYARLMTKVKGGKAKKLLKLPKVNLKRTARDETAPKREAQKRSDELWERLERTGDDAAAAALIADIELSDL
jgi:hypothetical protein